LLTIHRKNEQGETTMRTLRYIVAIITLLLIIFGITGCDSGNNTAEVKVTDSTASDNSRVFATTKNHPIDIELTYVGDKSITFSVSELPANGLLTGELSGQNPTMTYTPNQDYVGNDQFKFTVRSDNGETSTGQVTINVLDTTDNTLDTDGDGLTDVEEINYYRTNPTLPDTDGDALSDGEEVRHYSYNPESADYEYNPLIADIPVFKLELTSAPSITLNYNEGSSNSRSITTERSNTSSTSVTNSSTESNSTTVENSVTDGINIGFSGKALEGGYERTETNTTTTQTSHSWSQEQTKENSETYSEAESYEASNSVDTFGGELRLTAKVVNNGHVPFTLKSLTLSAIEVDELGRVERPIGNLNFDGEGSFPEYTMAGDESSGHINFSIKDLNLYTTRSLLNNSQGLIVSTALTELVKKDGTPFKFDQAQIANKTASIIIDYGLSREIEKFKVSTVNQEGRYEVSLAELLQDTLKIPFTASDTKLNSLHNIMAEDGDDYNFWVVIHLASNGYTESATVYGYQPSEPDPEVNYLPLNANQMEQILVKAGDYVQLLYISDNDQDGLLERTEALLGTDPELADSDGDGLNDKEEIEGWEVTVESEGLLSLNELGYGKADFWPSANTISHRAFAGLIDEVRLWDYARTPEDIAAFMNTTVTPQSGLIGYWPMDSYDVSNIDSSWSDTVAIQADASGQNHPLYLRRVDLNTLVNNSDDGDFNNSYLLDGNDDQLSMENRLISDLSSFTLELRFKTLANGILFSNRNYLENHYTPAIYIDDNGRLRGMMWTVNSRSSQVLTSANQVNDGEWHHVALNYDAETQTQILYLDGVEVGRLVDEITFLGESETLTSVSNPVVVDTDQDGVSDFDEFNGLPLNGNTRSVTSATSSDTDRDFIADDADSLPITPQVTDVTMSISLNEQDISAPVVSGSVSFRRLPGDIKNYSVVILQQTQDTVAPLNRLQKLPTQQVSLNVGDTLKCDNNEFCWEVIQVQSYSHTDTYIDAASFNFEQNLDSSVAEAGYKVLLKVNDSWYESSQEESVSPGNKLRITIRFDAVINGYCRDGVSDPTCERAWQMNVDGVDKLVRRDSQYVRANSGQSMTNGLGIASATFSFVKKDLDGVCLTLRTRLAEIDRDNVFGNYHFYTICRDDGWGSAGNNSSTSSKDGEVNNIEVNSGSVGQSNFRGSFNYETPLIILEPYDSNTGIGVEAKAKYTIYIEDY
jgi:hypothetical protein